MCVCKSKFCYLVGNLRGLSVGGDARVCVQWFERTYIIFVAEGVNLMSQSHLLAHFPAPFPVPGSPEDRKTAEARYVVLSIYMIRETTTHHQTKPSHIAYTSTYIVIHTYLSLCYSLSHSSSRFSTRRSTFSFICFCFACWFMPLHRTKRKFTTSVPHVWYNMITSKKSQTNNRNKSNNTRNKPKETNLYK